jgi:translation initiation factor 2 subunit 2
MPEFLWAIIFGQSWYSRTLDCISQHSCCIRFLSEAMAEEEEFDFGTKKKKDKKEKKEKKEKKDDDKEEKGDSAAPVLVGGGDEGLEEVTYTYDDLLTRLYQIIEDKNPALGGGAKKFVVKPPTTARVGSKKVAWVNFTEIVQMMNRSTEHVMGFVLAEFGTEGSLTGEGALVLKGRFLPKHMESLLKKYIREYVTCQMCRSPDTDLTRDQATRLHMVKCNNCGAHRSAAGIKSGYHAVTRKERRAARA